MAVIAFGKVANRIWAGSGWAFRQVLRDVSESQADAEIKEILTQAATTGSLVVDLLTEGLQQRIAAAVVATCDDILSGRRSSTIAAFHDDPETRSLYAKELVLLRDVARGDAS